MAKYKDGTTYKIFRQESSGDWTRLFSTDDKENALEALKFERKMCSVLPIVLQECVKTTIDYGLVTGFTQWYWYRWIYSEGPGTWLTIQLRADLTAKQVEERMSRIEIEDGPSYGVRWSSFEYKKVINGST